MTTRAHASQSSFSEFLMIGGVVAAALLLLPALAMFGFFMQFAFVIVGPLTLIAALVYALLSPVEPLESVGVRRPT